MTKYLNLKTEIYAENATEFRTYDHLQDTALTTDLNNILGARANTTGVYTQNNAIIAMRSEDALNRKITQILGHLQTHTLAEWRNDINYDINNTVREPNGTKIYISTQNNNENNALTNPTYWTLLFDLTTIANNTQYFKQQIILSNNITDPNNDIDFSAGNFVFHDNTGFANLSAITKRLDANFAIGNNQGGLDTGSKQINTPYYAYAIYNPTTTVSDVVFSANNTSPTLPSGFTKYRYIGILRTDGAGNILQGIWNKDGYFEYNTPIIDFTGSITTSRVARTLTVKPNSRALINVVYSSTLPGGTISQLYLSDLNKADNSIERLSANIGYKTSGEFQMQTNSSSQIGTRTSNANNTIQISTIGFYDLDL